MERATTLYGVLRVTAPDPLKGDDFTKFFVETDEARGVNAVSQLSDYFHANRDMSRKVLFMGHRGSGKSTELYRFEQDIQNKFRVINFSIKDEIDITDLKYVDLIFVILNKLYNEARKDNISINRHILDNLDSYWHDEHLIEKLKVEKASLDTEGQVKGGIWSVLSFHVKGILSTGRESKEVIRKYIEPRLNLLLTGANDLIDNISAEYKKLGKVPLLIIDDLDKLDIAVAEDLFLNYKNILTSFNIHIIYTFPIFLHYSEKFNEIRSVFDSHKLLSIIKVTNKDGSPNPKGKNIISKIVDKRADLKLFEPEALNLIIEKSGGALRHIFEMILNATLDIRSRDKNATAVDILSAKRAYRELQSGFERTIARRHLDTLKELYTDTNKNPMGNENLMEMLNCMAVIEYNGDRWCGLHPAVVDYLRKIEEI